MSIFNANVSTPRVSYDCPKANVISYRPRIKPVLLQRNLARLRLARLSSRGTRKREYTRTETGVESAEGLKLSQR